MTTTRDRFETIDQYIGAFPKDVQDILEGLRKAIRDAAPDAQETIAYGIPTFKLNGNLVHFAGYKKHIGFYPGGPSAIEAFKDELTKYKQSKGTIQFPLDESIPLELVKRIVKFRVKQNASPRKKK
ncbi:MAG: DUF1801 domain-containing protein [Candidatus Thorarchaeota archaeon]|nr:DUF1801 domain-containing protein [Candidatus Thorarchaeota archaeon]